MHLSRYLPLATLALAASPVFAVEGGIGRPITGMQVSPYAGIIPPQPGWLWQVGYTYYSGEIGAAREVPIAGQIAVGLEADMNLFSATGIYVWDTGEGRWNFASMLTASWIDLDIQAGLVTTNASFSTSDDVSEPFDLYFAPIIASYHINALQHVSFGLFVYAPTASFDTGKLANPGANVWTVTPTVSYTQLLQQGTLEFTATTGLQFYSRNEDTDYQNGELLTVDVLLMKRFGNGWGVGAVAGWIEQISDDDSAFADRVGGFRGHSLGVGPTVAFSHKTAGGTQLDFNARWVSEFDVKNRFEGNAAMLSLGITF